MAVTYGFFNSVNGDRTYNADQISDYFLKLISNGVFATPADSMQVQASSGMVVNVSAGWGFINCKWIKNDAPFPLTIDASDIVLNRIDRVVLRLDATSAVRSITIAVKKGTPASTATPPALERVAGGVWELSLAQIAVNANATAITQANITDERADNNVCGWVTGLIDQIDTTNLFAQYNAAFNTWFNSIKDEVKTTTIVVQYHSRYTTGASSVSTIPINIAEYNNTLDILNVYVNGMKLVEGTDYTISGTSVVLTNALDVEGTPVDFEVLKSMDSDAPESVVPALLAVQNRVTALETSLGGLSFVKCTQTQYDNMSSHNANTIYIIYDES